MNLKGLHLLLSYQCTYECDHCFVHSSPRAEGTMSLAFARDAIRQASEIGTIEEIYIEGGEPFLFYPILLELVRYARSLNFSVGIVTNSYFATTVEDAIEWLQPFAEMDKVYLSISDDDYHSNPDEMDTPASRALEAANQLDIPVDAICIEPPSERENEKVPGEPIIGGGVRFKGRAAEKLADESLPRRPWDSFTKCPDEDFIDVGRFHLDGYGNLWACQGITVGNLNEQSLSEILESYDPELHPIIDPLQQGGPAELVRQYNLPLQGEYLDACHLCYLARKQLLEEYPEELAPKNVYGIE